MIVHALAATALLSFLALVNLSACEPTAWRVGAATIVPPSTTTTTTTTAAPVDDVAATLACIRSVEQGAAGYATETGNGYHGAYQMDQGTWRGAAERAGYPEWADRPASEAPPHVQDAAAAQLLIDNSPT